MSDFGTPPFHGGVTPIPSPPPPTQPERGSSRPFLLCLLILACAGLGALLNWGIREHKARTQLAYSNLEIQKSYVFVLAKRNDLATFLTDEKTRLYRLPGRHEANGSSVTIAWQEHARTGILIGDRMPVAPDGQTFALWRLDTAHHPSPAGTFESSPAGTYYDFRVPTPTESGTAGFVVSLENQSERSPGKPGRVVYETR